MFYWANISRQHLLTEGEFISRKPPALMSCYKAVALISILNTDILFTGCQHPANGIFSIACSAFCGSLGQSVPIPSGLFHTPPKEAAHIAPSAARVPYFSRERVSGISLRSFYLVLYILGSVLLCVTATFGGLFIEERL